MLPHHEPPDEISRSTAAHPRRGEENPESVDQTNLRRTVHDLKNWVSGIKLFCDGALMESSPFDSKEALLQIQVAAHEAARLCETILTEEPEPDCEPESGNDPGELLGKIRNLLAMTLPPDVELRWEVDADLPPIQGDARELDRILLNLIKNAAEALEGHAGCITVRSRLTPNRETESSADSPRQSVLIEVEDTGCGMDEATLSRLFKTSFTTKSGGHGLGLASVHQIVERHHGRMELQSQPGHGTRVRLWFPCQAVPANHRASAKNAPAQQAVPRRGQRILWIDDDRSHREMGRVLLESRGFVVSTEATTEQALKALATEEAAFSVVLLDMHLPDLPGGEALRRLQTLAPQLPVIIVSGSPRRELEAELGCLEPDAYVEKPFDVESLIAAVRKVTNTNGAKSPVECVR